MRGRRVRSRRESVKLAFAVEVPGPGVKYLTYNNLGFVATIPSKVVSVQLTAVAFSRSVLQLVLYGPSSEEVVTSQPRAIGSTTTSISVRVPANTDFHLPAANDKVIGFKVPEVLTNTGNYDVTVAGTITLNFSSPSVCVVPKLSSEDDFEKI